MWHRNEPCKLGMLLSVGIVVSACGEAGVVPWTAGNAEPVATGSSAPDVAVRSVPADAAAPPVPGAVPPGIATPSVGVSQRANLQWKRHVALEADLMTALELPQDALCKEFGLANCIHDVHLGPLGGHDPFRNGLLESTAEPLVTTPTVIDRVVLAACSARVALDLQAGQPSKVFEGIDLAGRAPPSASAAHRSLATALFQRFLARDPEELELSALGELTTDASGMPSPARDYALASCYVVGTLTEFLFF